MAWETTGATTGLHHCAFARMMPKLLLVSGTAVLLLISLLGSASVFGGGRAFRKMPWTAARQHAQQAPSTHGSAHIVWKRQALANLTSYKSTLLSRMVPLWGKKEFWSVHRPIVTCPPGRPLTRYGGNGDGSKLLCKLTDALQGGGCVIYSLGSNGTSLQLGRSLHTALATSI